MSDKYAAKVKTLVNIAEADLRYKTILEIAEKFEVDFAQVEKDFTQAWVEEFDDRVKIIEDPELDYATKLLKKESISNWLRNFISDKKEREQLIHSKMIKDEPVKIYTIADLKALRKKNRSKYFVTGLFQAGLYFIVAQAKTGKSLVGYNLSVSILQGIPFLNRKTTMSNVLIIQNEEELGSTGQKIDSNGLQEFQRENPEQYNELITSNRLIVVKGLDIAVDRQKILDLIDEYDIKCLVIDSFRASIGKGGLTEYDIGAASALYALQAAVHERNILAIVIHHANKSDNNSGKTAAFNGIGGHNALAGANDGVVKLMRNSEKKVDGNETIDLHFYPRNDNPCTFNIVYREEEACKWGFEVLDESTLSDAMVANICSVLVALHEPYAEWLSLDEETRTEYVLGKSIDQLVLDTGIERPALVKILNYLDHNEAIGRYSANRKWIYHIPAEGSEMFYLVEDMEKRSEEAKRMEELLNTIYTSILACQTVEELDQFRGDLDDEIRESVRKNAPEHVNEHITKLRKPPKYAVGDKVVFQSAPGEVYEVESVSFKGNSPNPNVHRWLYHLKGLDDAVEMYELDAAPVTVEAETVKAEVVEDLDF